MWSREDDTSHDFYRPLLVHQLAAALGDDGRPAAMTQRVALPSVTARSFNLLAQAQDALMTEAAVARCAMPATRHDLVKHDARLRVGCWRSVSRNMNAWANESFIDALAAAGQGDGEGLRHLHGRIGRDLDGRP